MVALERALHQLEKSGFSRAFDDLTAHRGGFPSGWLTARKINNELTARGFWRGARSVVHEECRLRVLKHFLDQRVDHPTPDAYRNWKRFDGQYKRNPQTRMIDYRKAGPTRGMDRRALPRTPVRGVRCQYGRVLDLSPVGLSFVTVEPPKMKAGDRGFLRITHGNVSLRVRAKAVWVTPNEGGTRVGMDFRGLTVGDQQTLTRMMLAAAEEG
jgi:hypothetical protein